MQYDFPSPLNARKVGWRLSEETRSIVKLYAEFTDYTEEQVADMFLRNLSKNTEFVKWIEAKNAKAKKKQATTHGESR